MAKAAAASSNSDSPTSRQLGRQKCIEQPTVTAASPVSPGQVATVTSSDQSSSPAVSSISSQVTSTDNGQHTIWNDVFPLSTPTVERLLPIGATRPTGNCALHVVSDNSYGRTGASVAVAGPRPAQRILRCEDAYGSPESPLSKMDVLTVSE